MSLQQQQASASAKRKRSKRPRPTEEEYLALCLVMLANGRVDPAVAKYQAEYNCRVCGKAFASYQALGGHKASHRKLLPGGVDEQPVAAASPAAAGRVHRCDVCSKAFPSGQALGGHKRCHYEGSLGGGSGVTCSEGASSSHRAVFDLNVPALPEFDAFEAARRRVVMEEEEVQSPLPMKKPRFLVPA